MTIPINKTKYDNSKQWVLTPAGEVEISTLKVGDIVIGKDGQHNRIKSVEIEKTPNNFIEVAEGRRLFPNQSVFANHKLIHAKDLKPGDTLEGQYGERIATGTPKKGKATGWELARSLTARKVANITEFFARADKLQAIQEAKKKLIGGEKAGKTKKAENFVKDLFLFYKFEIDGDKTYFINGILVHNASRYWVGDGGLWDTSDTNHWSATSGGSAGASAPTQSDNVYFDAASFSTADQTISVNSAVCNNLDFTGVDNAPVLSQNEGDYTINVFGNLVLSSGLGTTDGWYWYFQATSGTKTITSAGKDYNWIHFVGIGGTWQLQDNLIHNVTIQHIAGTVDLNGYTLTTNGYEVSEGETTGLVFGSGTLEIAQAILILASADLTITANTGVISFTSTAAGSTIEFYTGGKTFYKVQATSLDCDLRIIGNLTVTDFTIVTRNTGYKGASLIVQNGKTITVSGTCTFTVTSSCRLFVRTDKAGTAGTLNVETMATLTDVDFMDITAAGTAQPFSGTRLGNCLGNTNITFNSAVTRYWVGNGGNWNDTAHWSATSGGTSGSTFPLPQDTAIFDAASFSATSTVYCTNPRMGSVNFSAIDQAVTFSGTYIKEWRFQDGFVLDASLTMSCAYSVFMALCPRSTKTYDFTGVSEIHLYIFIEAPGGTATMGSDYTGDDANGGQFHFVAGTFDANDFDISAYAFAFQPGGSYGGMGSYKTWLVDDQTRAVVMGSGTWSLTTSGTAIEIDETVDTNLTITCETSTIALTANANGVRFYPASKTFYNLVITGGSVATDSVAFQTLIGTGETATFNDVTMTGTGTLGLYLQGTFTVDGTLTLTATSSSQRIKVINNDAGIALHADAISLTDVNFKGILAEGTGSSWTGTRLGDLGSNTGITFGAGADKFWVGDTGNLSDATNHWATSTGGSPGANNFPLPQDTLKFDANSFTTTDQTVTNDVGTLTVKSMIWTGATNTPNFDLNYQNFYVLGNLTFISAMGLSNLPYLYFNGSANQTFTTGGLDFNNGAVEIYIEKTGGTLTLGDGGATFGSLSACEGSFDTAGYDFTVAILFQIDSGMEGTLTLGDSVITFTGEYDVFVVDGDPNLTVSAGTSTFIIETNVAGEQAMSIWINGTAVGQYIQFNNLVFRSGADNYAGILYLNWTTDKEYNTSSGVGYYKGIKWNDFTIEDVADVKTVAFSSYSPTASVYEFETIDWQGASGQLITITNGSAYFGSDIWARLKVNDVAGSSVQYVDVSDNDASLSNAPIDDTVGGVNTGGNNKWWLFLDPVVYSETIKSIGLMGNNTVGKLFAETASVGVGILQSTSRTFVEVLAVVSAKLYQASKTFTETIKAIPVFAKVGTFVKTMTEIVSVASSKLYSIARIITERIVVAGNALKQTAHQFVEAITTNDPDVVLNSVFLKICAEVIIAGGALGSFVIGRIFIQPIKVIASLLNQSTFYKVLSEVVKAVSSSVKTTGRTFSQSLTVISSRTQSASRTFVEVVSVVSNKLYQIARTFTQSIIVAPVLATVLLAYRVFSEVISVGWERGFGFARSFIETIKTSHLALILARAKVIVQSLTVGDSFTRALAKLFVEIVSVDWKKGTLRSVNYIENLIVAVVFMPLVIGKLLIERIVGSTTWEFVKTQFVELTDAVSVRALATKSIGRTFISVIRVGSSKLYSIARTFVQVIKVGMWQQEARAFVYSEILKVGGALQSFVIGKVLPEVVKVRLVFTEGRNWIMTETVKVGVSLVSAITRIFTEIVSMTGAMAGWSMARTFTQSVKMTATRLFRKTQYKVLSDALKASGQAFNKAGKTFAEVISAVSAMGNWVIGKVIVQPVIVIASYIKAWTLSRVFAEVVKVGGNVFNQGAKIFAEVISATDTFVRGALGKGLYETINVIQVITKSLPKTFSEVVSVSGNALNQGAKIFTETVSVVGQFVLGTISKVLIEIVKVVQTFTSAGVFKKVFTETVQVVSNDLNQIGKIFTATIRVVGAMANFTIAKLLTQTIKIGETFTKTTSRIFVQVVKVVSSSVKFMSGRVFLENPKIVGAMQKFAIGKLFVEVVSAGWSKTKFVLNGIQVGLWKKVARITNGVWRKISRNDN